MRISAALYAHLCADAGLAAIVGTRIYPVYAPALSEGETMSPTIVFRQEQHDRFDNINARSGVKPIRFSVACLGDDYDSCWSIADALETCLEGYRGTLGGLGGVVVGPIKLRNQWDEVQNPFLGYFISVSEFEIPVGG